MGGSNRVFSSLNEPFNTPNRLSHGDLECFGAKASEYAGTKTKTRCHLRGTGFVFHGAEGGT